MKRDKLPGNAADDTCATSPSDRQSHRQGRWRSSSAVEEYFSLASEIAVHVSSTLHQLFSSLVRLRSDPVAQSTQYQDDCDGERILSSVVCKSWLYGEGLPSYSSA